MNKKQINIMTVIRFLLIALSFSNPKVYASYVIESKESKIPYKKKSLSTYLQSRLNLLSHETKQKSHSFSIQVTDDDEKDAAKRLRKKADQGNITAQLILGKLYATGQGLPKDITKAMHWFKKAADSGDPWAQTVLGSLYKTGKYIPKDIKKAKYWYTKAANQGDKTAQQYLKDLNYK